MTSAHAVTDSPETELRVLVCDDHPIVRSGLVALISTTPGLVVVGEASDGLQAADLAVQLQPAVVLLDLSMPRLDGIETIRRIRTDAPTIRLLVLTMHDDSESVRRVREAGGHGYLVKGVDLAVLIQALQTVGQGGEWFRQEADRQPDPLSQLTPREREVLTHIAEGYTNREIGLLLDISPKTVEKHRASLMDKLEAHDTASLTRRAIAAGLVRAEAR